MSPCPHVPAPEAVAARCPHTVGVDPSLTATGVASSRGWLETVGRTGITGLALPARITAVDALVTAILELVGRPDLVCIETPAFSRTGGGALERHALWWLLVRALAGKDIPTAAVNVNARMRYATGKGAASKSAVVDAVARRFPDFATGGDDNACDALVLCAAGADHLGHPLAAMPATHRAALGTVDWPPVPGWPAPGG